MSFWGASRLSLKQPLSPVACQKQASWQHKTPSLRASHWARPYFQEKKNPCSWARTNSLMAGIFLSLAREGTMTMVFLNPCSGKSHPEIPACQTFPHQGYCPLTCEYTEEFALAPSEGLKKDPVPYKQLCLGLTQNWGKGQSCYWPAIFTEQIS